MSSLDCGVWCCLTGRLVSFLDWCVTQVLWYWAGVLGAAVLADHAVLFLDWCARCYNTGGSVSFLDCVPGAVVLAD